MANNNNNTQNNNDTGKKYKVEVLEPIPFGSTMGCNFTTTIELAHLVNSLFAPLFADFVGSIVQPASAADPNQQFAATMQNNQQRDIFNYPNVTLMFRDTNKELVGNMIKNLQPCGTDANAKMNSKPIEYKNMGDKQLMDSIFNPMNPIAPMNITGSRKIHELTKETKEALSDFIPGVQNNNNFWTKNVYEVSDSTGYGNLNYTIHLCVPGIDLREILKAIYGKKEIDENGETHYIDYMVNMVKPMMMAQQGYNAFGVQPNNATYLCVVNRLDNKYLDELCTKMGMYNFTSTINMVRA